MTETAERQVAPGLRISALGPHEVAGGQFYALFQDLPNSITLTYSTHQERVVEFTFSYQGLPVETDANHIDLGQVSEALSASVVSEGGHRRVKSLKLSGLSVEDLVRSKALESVVAILPALVATKTHLQKNLIVSAVAVTKLLGMVARQMLEQVKTATDREPLGGGPGRVPRPQ